VAQYELREISPDDKVSGLSLGAQEYTPLKIYLKKHAKRHHVENAGKTYVFVEKGDATKSVVAYITLLCSRIELKDPPDGLDEYRFPDYPAVKIARLAVDTDCRGLGLGSELVALALAITKNRVMPHVGCRFLVVDSKSGSVEWYRKRGFTLLNTDENRAKDHPVMFIDVGRLP
jgi:ribosomal protein S18 acetylase RimI-like enzyme